MAWGQGVPLVDGDSVGDPVPRVHDSTSGAARAMQGQHSPDGHIHARGVEGLEHDLSHPTIALAVQGGLGRQHGVLLGGHAQLVVEGMVPDLLHSLSW